MTTFIFVRWKLMWLKKMFVHNIECHYDANGDSMVELVQIERQTVTLCNINYFKYFQTTDKHSIKVLNSLNILHHKKHNLDGHIVDFLQKLINN